MLTQPKDKAQDKLFPAETKDIGRTFGRQAHTLPSKTEVEIMQKLVAGGLLILVIVAVWPTLTSAHSWYPRECCSNQDCMPADRIEVDARGDLRVIVGALRIWVPRGFAVRPSQDRQIHICFREEKDLKFLMPLCLFMPAES